MLEKFVQLCILRSNHHGLTGVVARRQGLVRAAKLLRQALARIEAELERL